MERRPYCYNAHTGRYVLWFNIYDSSTDTNYRVFESRHPTGPFVERTTPAQLAVSTDLASGEGYNGDENLFVDDDGTAYLVHTDFRRGGDIVVEQLDPRYETGTGRFARLGLFATKDSLTCDASIPLCCIASCAAPSPMLAAGSQGACTSRTSRPSLYAHFSS